MAINVWPIDPMPYHYEGQYVPRDIYARVGFKVLSPAKLAAEESKIHSSTPAVFRLDSKGLADFISKLQAYPDSLKAATAPAIATLRFSPPLRVIPGALYVRKPLATTVSS